MATIVISLFFTIIKKVEYFTIETDNRLFLLFAKFQHTDRKPETDGFDWKKYCSFALLAVSLSSFRKIIDWYL